jgi:replicative DNA helicase
VEKTPEEQADWQRRLTARINENAEKDRLAKVKRTIKAWEARTPDPLGAIGFATHPYPSSVFPPVYGSLIEALAVSAQVDVSITGSSVLGALAAASRIRVVSEDWQEPGNLFLAIGAPPGSRKSYVHQTVIEPLLAVEKELADAARPSVARGQAAWDIKSKQAHNAVQAAAREPAASKLDEDGKPLPDGPPAGAWWDSPEIKALVTEHQGDWRKAKALKLAMELAETPRPALPKLVVDDITPEALASTLAEQGGRVALLSAEGGIFDIMAGRYNGGIPNIEVFLKGHAGDMLKVDRKGRESEYLAHPALTVSLMVQPSVLQAIGEIGPFRGRGLLARFLYCIPVSNIGTRDTDPATLPPSVIESYTTKLGDLARSMHSLETPRQLTLNPAARKALIEFTTEIEPLLAGSLAHVADWASKLAGATMRISGLLHVAAGYPTHTITQPTMLGAIKLGRFYLAHALGAFDLMGDDQITVLASVVLTALIKRGITTEFSRRDLDRRYVQKRDRKEMDEALKMLVSMGWLLVTESPGYGSGQRTGRYRLHPSALLSQ